MKHVFLKKTLAIAMVVSTAVGPLTTNACTSFLLKGSDSGYVYGRTLEFGLPLHSEIIVIPKNLTLQGIGVNGQAGSGLNWSTKYGVAGMNALQLPVLVDGMNEVGLIGGLLNAPNTAQYQKTPPSESQQSISSVQMLTYALTNFATIDEVKAGFQKIQVNDSKLAAYNNSVVPVRMTLHDRNGKSLVIEYLNGQLMMTDNPVGVMTNDPAFREQLQTIGSYANLSKIERDPITINGATFPPSSSGSGLHGLPGSYLSPDRFIRAIFLASSVPTNFTSAQQVNSAFHILGSFDIPPGAVTLPASNPYGGGSGGYEVTEWSTVADNKNMVYYVKMYENLNIQSFDFKKADFNAKEVKTFRVSQIQSFEKLN